MRCLGAGKELTVEEGKFYLFACPWDWTFVGRFRKQLSFQELVIDKAIYFTRTGATFDKLCSEGLNKQSLYHHVGDGIIIPAQAIKFPWAAKTPWAK
jgi:hypothetical protein